jgi:hypothetical protein
VFESRVLSRMFGPKRDEVTEEWRKLHNEEHHIHLEDQGVDGRMGSEWILGRLAGRVYIGSRWLRIGAGGRLL